VRKKEREEERRGKNKSIQGRVAEWVPRRVLRSMLQSSSKAIFKKHSSAGACQFDHFRTCGPLTAPVLKCLVNID